jgi:NADPH-dependent glutamate synthase beta subunit-like oxidoreductase
MSEDPVSGRIRQGLPAVGLGAAPSAAERAPSWKRVRPVYRDKVAPCDAACPVGIDVEGVLHLLREGRTEEARDLLLRENPMPAVTGRVCDQPCQAACNRAAFDEAVNIHAVERMLGDSVPGSALVPPPRTRTGSIAVVGSGPAGLACAYHLARLGYAVDVLEGESEPGGALRRGLPEYRLPRAVLDREIERVRAQGVEIRCGVEVGRTLPWERLGSYDAVFVATGARLSRPFELAGQEQADVRQGLDFLRENGAGERGPVGPRVIIVGGTDTAVDCARTALRLGAEPVVLCQGARPELSANADAVDESIREGVRFELQSWPVGIHAAGHREEEPALEAIRTMFDEGEADQPRPRLVGVECVRMRPERGPDGTRRNVPVEGSAFTLPADTLILALGEEPDLGFLPVDITRRSYVVKVDEFGRTSHPRYFAGGDITGEPRTVAHSLGSGKRAAIGIDRMLRERSGEAVPALDPAGLRLGGTGNFSITRWRGDDPVQRVQPLNEVVRFESLNMTHFASVPSKPDRHRSFEERRSSFAEANLGLTADEALAEARRCFECGVCTMCELCLIFCPEVAIRRDAGGRGFAHAPESCRACGTCVRECPRGAMDLEAGDL